MAKRLTDTQKWAKPGFGDLSLKMKLIWVYLCDSCDHAGVWDINLKLLVFHVGEATTLEEIQAGLGDKIAVLPGSKLFLSGFIEFQYGELNPDNRVHKSVLARLEKLKIKGLTSPFQGAKEKEKDKDKVIEKEKEKETAPQNIMTSEGKARMALLAVQKFGPDESKALKKFVGDDLFREIQSAGGWQSVREMKRDNWAMSNLAKRLSPGNAS